MVTRSFIFLTLSSLSLSLSLSLSFSQSFSFFLPLSLLFYFSLSLPLSLSFLSTNLSYSILQQFVLMNLCMYPLCASNSYFTTWHLTSVCSHVYKTPLPDFPHRPIDFLQVWRDVGNVSYTATISNNMIPDLSGEVDGY